MMYHKILLVFALSGIISLTTAEIVKYNLCPENGDHCQIHEVRINPCPESDIGEPCRIKRGRTASMEFEFTPNFNVTQPKAMVYWASPDGDIEMPSMDTNGCSYTDCPVAASTRKSFSYSLRTAKKFPIRIFEIKWVLSDPDNLTEQCCFLTKIKLVR